MKVCELEGPLLDYWVAKAEGLECSLVAGVVLINETARDIGDAYRPSSDWAQGGPIIEREKLVWTWVYTLDRASKAAMHAVCGRFENHDPSPLVAAMRAFVARKFGEEVSQ